MINILNKQVAELIAAGEVVERPASIVKELLENSVDAGATSVTVEIAGGGITYLRVSDNGHGIPHNQVKTAFLRHATSKLKNKDDLEKIGTLGFRGEALASICAVSKMEMVTKTPKSITGTRYCINGADISADKDGELSETGAADGTTIIVRDLFYNIPARLKFLKKESVESAAITEIIENTALSHPNISFKYIRNNKIIVHTPGDGLLKSTIYSLKDSSFAENLLPVEYTHEYITNGLKFYNNDKSHCKITGFISKPETALPSRSCQKFFVNGRVVKSTLLSSALEEGYKSSSSRGKFPACYLSLYLPYENVDVNVHPAKIEVKFAQEQEVYNSVYFAVKNTSRIFNEEKITQTNLPQRTYFNDTESEQVNIFNANEKANKQELRTEEAIYPIKKGQTFEWKNDDNEKKDDELSRFKHLNFSRIIRETPTEQEENNSFIQEKTEAYSQIYNEDESMQSLNKAYNEDENLQFANNDEVRTRPNQNSSYNEDVITQPVNSIPCDVILLGEVFKTYIIAQYGDSMFIIDKHAAHERIIYNKITSEKEISKQIILAPLPVQLSPVEFALVTENAQLISELGFSFDEFGNNAIIIREVPAILESADAANIFKEIAANMASSKKDISPEVLRELYCQKACKAAIKANDDNNTTELCELAKNVIEDENIRYCPHGRPVLLTITKDKLAKMMGR